MLFLLFILGLVIHDTTSELLSLSVCCVGTQNLT